MKREDVVTKVMLPVLLAMISATVTLYLATRQPAGKLLLETVRVNPGDEPATAFGSWVVETRPAIVSAATKNIVPNNESTESFGNTCIGRYWRIASYYDTNLLATWNATGSDQPSALRPNAIGVDLYIVEWFFHRRLPDDLLQFAVDILGAPIGPTRTWWETNHFDAADLDCRDFKDAVGGVIEPPVVDLMLRNSGKRPVSIVELVATPIANFGGEAGGGGVTITRVGDITEVVATYHSISVVPLNEPVGLDADMSTLIPVRLVVEHATAADGPGALLFQLAIRYFDGKATRHLTIGNFLLGDRAGD